MHELNFVPPNSISQNDLHRRWRGCNILIHNKNKKGKYAYTFPILLSVRPEYLVCQSPIRGEEVLYTFEDISICLTYPKLGWINFFESKSAQFLTRLNERRYTHGFRAGSTIKHFTRLPIKLFSKVADFHNLFFPKFFSLEEAIKTWEHSKASPGTARALSHSIAVRQLESTNDFIIYRNKIPVAFVDNFNIKVPAKYTIFADELMLYGKVEVV